MNITQINDMKPIIDDHVINKEKKYNGMSLSVMPMHIIRKILYNLIDQKDMNSCRLASRKLKEIIEGCDLGVNLFCCQHQPVIREICLKTINQCRESSCQWLKDFSANGKEMSEELADISGNNLFHKRLFYYIAKTLSSTSTFSLKEIYSINHKSAVQSIAFSPDGNYIVTTSLNGTSVICKFVNNKWEKNAIIEHCQEVNDVNFSLDGTKFVIASGSNIKIFEIIDGEWNQKYIFNNTSDVHRVKFSDDGKQIIATLHNQFVVILGFSNGEWSKKDIVENNGYYLWSAGFSICGDYLLISYDIDNAIILEFTDKGYKEKSLLEHGSCINSAKFSPDGNYIITISLNYTVKIWAFINGKVELKDTIEHEGYVSSAIFSEDGTHIITASSDKTAKIWWLIDDLWKKKYVINHSSELINAIFSPDRTHIILTCTGQKSEIWGFSSGEWCIKGTVDNTVSEVITNYKFSPHGFQIAIVNSKPGEVKLCELKMDPILH